MHAIKDNVYKHVAAVEGSADVAQYLPAIKDQDSINCQGWTAVVRFYEPVDVTESLRYLEKLTTVAMQGRGAN